MKDITEYLKETILSESKADLSYYNLGNGTTIANKNKEVNGDYETVAHVSDSGIITWQVDAKKYDKTAVKDVISYAKKNELRTKEEKKLSEVVSKLLKSGKEFKIGVKSDKPKGEMEVRTVIVDKKKVYYKVDGKQLPFSHSQADVVSMVGDGTYTVMENDGINDFMKYDNSPAEARAGMKKKKLPSSEKSIPVIVSTEYKKNMSTHGIQFWNVKLLNKGHNKNADGSVSKLVELFNQKDEKYMTKN